MTVKLNDKHFNLKWNPNLEISYGKYKQYLHTANIWKLIDAIILGSLIWASSFMAINIGPLFLGLPISRYLTLLVQISLIFVVIGITNWQAKWLAKSALPRTVANQD